MPKGRTFKTTVLPCLGMLWTKARLVFLLIEKGMRLLSFSIEEYTRGTYQSFTHILHVTITWKVAFKMKTCVLYRSNILKAGSEFENVQIELWRMSEKVKPI